MNKLRLALFCCINGVIIAASLLGLLNIGYLNGCSTQYRRVHQQTTLDKVLTTKNRNDPSLYPRSNETLSDHPFKLLRKNVLLVYKKFSLNTGHKYNSREAISEILKKMILQLNLDRHKIEQTNCQRKPFLLIEVHSKPESHAEREGIRLSWGRQSSNINQISMTTAKERSWKTVFLVGKSHNEDTNTLVRQEARIYKDVIIGDFLDTYRNLTLKTLLTLEWPANHCSSDYVLKTDHDCYVNVFSLIKLLDRYHESKRHKIQPLYLGNIHWKNTPTRQSTSKYYVTMQEFSGLVYPPYAAGGGYVFTASLIPRLLEASKAVAPFPMEDAYFGVLMKYIGVRPINNVFFLPYEFCECTLDDECSTWSEVSICTNAVAMVIHRVKAIAQIRMHLNVLTVKTVPSICQHDKHRKSCTYIKHND